MRLSQIKEILQRMAAVIVLKVSGVFALGSVAGVSLVQSAIVAAGMGILEVLDGLSRAYLDDGNLSTSEINTVFTKFKDKE